MYWKAIMSVRRPKAQRLVRRGKRPVVALSERDIELLTLVALVRYLSLTQAAREFFPSLDRARRRVRRLFDAGYLGITLTASTAPNLLSLTRTGLSAVLERVPARLGEHLRLAGPIRLAGVKHRLAITDTRLFAAQFGIAHGTPLTRWSNAGGELARERGLDSLHLDPDGVAEFAGNRFLAAEIDCSTEALGVLRTKLGRYAAAAASGRLHGMWLVLLGGIERRDNLRALIHEAGLSGWAFVLSHDQVLSRPVIAYDEPTLAAPPGLGTPRSLNTPHASREART